VGIRVIGHAVHTLRSIENSEEPFFDPCEPGHGRIQRWQLKACAVEPDAVDFPFARSVVIVRSERTMKKTAVSSFETRAYIAATCPINAPPLNGWS